MDTRPSTNNPVRIPLALCLFDQVRTDELRLGDWVLNSTDSIVEVAALRPEEGGRIAVLDEHDNGNNCLPGHTWSRFAGLRPGLANLPIQGASPPSIVQPGEGPFPSSMTLAEMEQAMRSRGIFLLSARRFDGGPSDWTLEASSLRVNRIVHYGEGATFAEVLSRLAEKL